MKRLSPIGALAIFWFIGIVTGKPGIWFPLGFLALIGLAAWRKRQAMPLS